MVDPPLAVSPQTWPALRQQSRRAASARTRGLLGLFQTVCPLRPRAVEFCGPATFAQVNLQPCSPSFAGVRGGLSHGGGIRVESGFPKKSAFAD
jgi:hypothetical protein